MKLVIKWFLVGFIVGAIMSGWGSRWTRTVAQSQVPYRMYQEGKHCIFIGPYGGTSADIEVVPC